MADQLATSEAGRPAQSRYRSGSRVIRRLGRNRLAIAGAAIVGAIAGIGLLAPALPLPAPNIPHFGHRLAAPLSFGYVLGSDQLGRDILSRLMWGTRTSLAVGVSAALLALALGSALGILAAYYGGRVDNLLMRGIDILMGFPEILLAIAIVAALGPGLAHAMLAVTISNVPFYARGIRGAVLLLRSSEFVESARAAGATGARVILRHLLPNILAPMLVFVSLNIGWMVTETAGLSFLGLGAQPPTPDWGTMLADGRGFITIAPHVAAAPGLTIFLSVLGFNTLGEGLREVLDPRSR
jgi:peptide/nickel transport system ATP-binding protein/peptide/nickel transport system permease protein